MTYFPYVPPAGTHVLRKQLAEAMARVEHLQDMLALAEGRPDVETLRRVEAKRHDRREKFFYDQEQFRRAGGFRSVEAAARRLRDGKDGAA